MQPGRSGALGSWVPSVGGDCEEAAWWHPSDLQTVCLGGTGSPEQIIAVRYGASWINTERSLLGRKGVGPDCCCIAVDQ